MSKPLDQEEIDDLWDRKTDWEGDKWVGGFKIETGRIEVTVDHEWIDRMFDWWIALWSNRGLKISLALSAALMITVGIATVATTPASPPALTELERAQQDLERAREANEEANRRIRDLDRKGETGELGPPGPAGPMPDEDRFQYDLWRYDTTQKFQDQEPRPRLHSR